MKHIVTKNAAVDCVLDTVYDFSLESALDLAKYLPFVINQKKLGAGTFGELALKGTQQVQGDFAMPPCPLCNSHSTIKNGFSSAGNPRYMCKECGKTFTGSVNTLGANVTQNAGKWMVFIQNLLQLETIKDNAIVCDVCESTILNWRLRVFEALEYLVKDIRLSGLVAADDTRVPYNFKGNHGPAFANPRRSRKRGGENTVHNYHKNQICVLCAIDEHGRSFSRCVGFGKPSGKRLINGFADKLCVNEQMIFVSDGDTAYGRAVEHYHIPRWEIRIAEKKGRKRYPAVVDDIHLQKINAYHSRLKEFLFPAHGVASRYLPGWLLLFDYKENHKHLSLDEQAIQIMSAMTQIVGKTSIEELKCKYRIPVSNGPQKYTWELKIPAAEQAIYRDWINGMPPKEVCAQHGIQRRKIYYIRDKVERYQVHDAIMSPEGKDTVPKTRQKQPISERDWEIFRRHCRDGETLKAIAQDYGFCHQAIHKVVQKIRRTPEGAALEKGWKKPTPSRKKTLPKDKLIQQIALLEGPKTSIREACSIVADMHRCRTTSLEYLYYEHRLQIGDIREAYRWKKERREMPKEDYYAFLTERNRRLYQEINDHLDAHPTLAKADAFAHFATIVGLSTDRVMKIYYDVRKGKFPTYRYQDPTQRPAFLRKMVYEAVQQEREKEPGLLRKQYIRRVAEQKNLSVQVATAYYSQHQKWLKQQERAAALIPVPEQTLESAV